MKRKIRMVEEDLAITMEDVSDLAHMEGCKLDILAAVVGRVIQKHQVAAPLPPSKKRNSHDGGEASSSASKKRKTMCSPPRQSPPLPPEFQRVIEDRARGRSVTAPILVIQKKLFATDVALNNNRLSIPISQIREDFLRAEEKGSKVVIKVELLAPSLEWVEGVKLSRWDMAKNNGGKRSSIYAVNGAWNEVVRKNVGLKEGTEVQLWCFRVDRDLHFALVQLK